MTLTPAFSECRWSFNPTTRRVTEINANPAFCCMTGLPVEELLARVARRDLPSHTSRLDHLCLIMDGLHAQLREEHLQYFRWQVRLSPASWACAHYFSKGACRRF